MATKKNPGTYDVMKKIPKDEPYFVLRAQDSLARNALSKWIHQAEDAGVDAEKVAEAKEVLKAFDEWPTKKLPD